MLKERRWYEWLAFIVHCTWNVALFSQLPTWLDVALVYFIASSLQGILHVQLLLNHYAKAFFQLRDINSGKDWYRAQIESNLDIVNPWWLDWFHGGLNLHTCHHLYPTMPRHNFRRATQHIHSLCQRLHIHHHQLCLSDALIYTLKHLKHSSHLYSLDPR